MSFRTGERLFSGSIDKGKEEVERHEGVAVPTHIRHVVHRAEQAGALGASVHPFQQQSEGEEDLKTKPELVRIIPLLKSTRQNAIALEFTHFLSTEVCHTP